MMSSSRGDSVARAHGILSGLYFLYFGSLGSILPYIALFFESRGMRPTEIAWLMTMLPTFSLIVPPLWGLAADALGSRVRLLRISCLLCGASILLLIPHWDFMTTLAVMAIFSCLRAPVTSLADAVTHACLGPNLSNFGHIRLWGSAGYVLSCLGFGWLYDHTHDAVPLIGTGLILILTGLITIPLSPYDRATTTGESKSVFAASRKFVTQPGPLIFFAAVCSYYTGHACFDAYFGLHMRALGYSDTFVGLAWALGVTVEVGVMIATPRLLRRFRAHDIIIFCCICSIVRWVILSEATSQISVLAAQPLHGLTFGLWYLAISNWVQKQAPSHLRATLQSITLSSMALGMIFGYQLGGPILETQGGSAVFQAAAIAASVALVLNTILRTLPPRPSAT